MLSLTECNYCRDMKETYRVPWPDHSTGRLVHSVASALKADVSVLKLVKLTEFRASHLSDMYPYQVPRLSSRHYIPYRDLADRCLKQDLLGDIIPHTEGWQTEFESRPSSRHIFRTDMFLSRQIPSGTTAREGRSTCRGGIDEGGQ